MSAHRHRILVIEDDQDMRDVTAFMLDGEGFDVVTAKEGQAALDSLRAGGAPCVILLDAKMAGMDGQAFRDSQLRDPELSDIPVIGITGDSDLMEGARRLGLRDCLQKPFEPDELLRVIRLHVSCR